MNLSVAENFSTDLRDDEKQMTNHLLESMRFVPAGKRWGMRLAVLLLAMISLWKPAQAQEERDLTVFDTTFIVKQIISDSIFTDYLDIKLDAHQCGYAVDSNELRKYVQVLEVYRQDTDTAIVHRVIPQHPNLDNMNLTVLVLLDVSGSMRERMPGGKGISKIEKAKNDIVRTINNHRFPEHSTYFSIFAESTSENIPLDSSVLETIKIPAEGVGVYTHLYESLWDKIEEMKQLPGQKAIVLMADGEDDLKPGAEPWITREEVIQRIGELDESFRIFPVGIGSSIYPETMREIVEATPYPCDSFRYNLASDSLSMVFGQIYGDEMPFSHTVQVSSPIYPHVGNEREFIVSFGTKTSKKKYREGALYNRWTEKTQWTSLIFLGSFVVGLSLILFMIVIPFLDWRSWKKKYVKKYWEVKQDNVHRHDPLTNFPFQDEDEVVIRCSHMTSLDTWRFESGKVKTKDKDEKERKKSQRKKQKNTCIHYPNRCKVGTGPKGVSDFTNQRGVYKKLWWTLFGFAGGFLAWGMWALFEVNRGFKYLFMLDGMSAKARVLKFFDYLGTQDPAFEIPRKVRETFVSPLLDNVGMGIVLAMSLALVFAFSEELSQSRHRKVITKILAYTGRILLRMICSGIVGGLIAFGGTLLHIFFLKDLGYIPGVLMTMLICASTGMILSIRSSIQFGRGLWGGLLAGFVGFTIYYFLFLAIPIADFEWAMLATWIIIGGIMGYILSKIVSRLETASIEYKDTGKQPRIVPIIQYLKAEEEVTVGRGDGAIVRIKGRTHDLDATYAKIMMRADHVYIDPIEQVFVNDVPIRMNRMTKLSNNDRITFGEKSFATLIYNETRVMRED